MENIERPDTKIAERIEWYTDLLTSSPGGWIGYLYPAFGGGVTFKFDFDKNQRVRMIALLNTQTVHNVKESSYSIRAPQVPSLYFDTYSYIHQLADPIITKYGGERLVGAGGDFEFSFVNASPDTIRLKGNFRGSDLLLVRADPTGAENYLRNVYTFTSQELVKVDRFKDYYKKLNYNGQDYMIIINVDKSTFSVYYNRSGKLQFFTTEFAGMENGILLREPFVDGEFSIQRFEDFEFDFTQNQLQVLLNGKEKIVINSLSVPPVIDLDGPAQIFSKYNRSFSTYGFNYDGQRDYHQLSSDPSFIGAHLRQRYYINNLDRFEFYYYDNSNMEQMFYYNLRSSINTPGVMKFDVYANFGTVPSNSSLLTAVNKFKAFQGDAGGFYVFTSGNDVYDFVSVDDSKKWFRFY
ncbi:DUF4302 domain-containing protein [Sphingobacterium paucimobilis]|nr:DUF4302 domain-containing protein [Sphingobacterium paucimobilis]